MPPGEGLDAVGEVPIKHEDDICASKSLMDERLKGVHVYQTAM